jgi:hypothetical protein
MVSKVGRFIPLAISGAVLIGFLINFKVFGFLFDRHYRFGAGVISVRDVSDVFYAPVISNIYLHFSLFSIFAIGLLLFVFYKRVSKGAYVALSLAMFLVFLLRPIITLVSMRLDGWTGLEYFTLSTFKGQLIGFNDNVFGSFFSIKSYVTGLFLLLLLIANVIISFIRKGNPGDAGQKQARPMQPQYAQPIPTPV